MCLKQLKILKILSGIKNTNTLNYKMNFQEENGKLA